MITSTTVGFAHEFKKGTRIGMKYSTKSSN